MATPAEFWNWNLTILVAFFAAYTFTRDLVEDSDKAWKALIYAVVFVVGIVILILILELFTR